MARRPSPHPRTPETETDTREATVRFDQEADVDEEPGRGRWNRWTWALIALSVFLVLSLAAGGWLFWRDHSSAATETDRDNVVLAARQEVLNLVGLSHTGTDATYDRLLSGDFRTQLTQQADSFKQAATQGQVIYTGQIPEAGVEQLGGDTATALVVASANIKNTQAPQSENRQYRLRLTLQRQDGQWLVSQLEFVA
ncbi:hypothetical protein [Parafrankia sp. FMc2]|uniref:hypothetical protein n=1 Tax=Parafrankia sp. FMc2 TaxID=3233196 RepID=UPI0034D56552